MKANLFIPYRVLLAISLAATVFRAHAQPPLLIYTDSLMNGFQDWSWGTRNFSNASPVHSGSASINHNGGAWNAISFEHADIHAAAYINLIFWANGGSGGGQILQIYAEAGTNSYSPIALSPLTANNWQQFVIPLSSLNVATVTNLNRLNLQITASGSTATFFIDDVQLTAAASPSLVHLQVNAGQPIRTADLRWSGVNTAVWDGNLDSAQTVSLLQEMGATLLRFPGGSLSDEYHWGSNTSLSNTWQWQSSFANFVHVATNAGVQACITVNYGTGTPQEAAAWVRHSNVTNHYGFKYWEIGNENYGGWETDTNNFPHDPYTYAVRAASYLQQMRAADPTIKIGVVGVTGENSYSNSYSITHPTWNPRTGQTNYGWMPVMLATLKNLGATPDFVVHHVYPEYTASENDQTLLQSATSWGPDAADLRQQITDYFGPAGTNIELLCTENNSNSGAQGKQSTSLVNGLYYADSLGQLMKTEFNAFIWWDLRNGTDYSGSMDPSLYGWRMYGDLGMIGGASMRYPPFYAAKIMQSLARAGDSILPASSDYLLLSAYAARRISGATTLMVLNKDTTSALTGQIALNGFIPNNSAAIGSFGIAQDEAARTNAPAAAQDIAFTNLSTASTTFNYSFPPLSLTLFTFPPAAPSLKAMPAALQPSGKFAFQMLGQSATRYYIQNSSNLTSWTTVSTNTLTASMAYLTNSIPPGSAAGFWRAIWQP